MENVERIGTPQTVLAFDDLSSTKFEDFINALALAVEKYGNSVFRGVRKCCVIFTQQYIEHFSF